MIRDHFNLHLPSRKQRIIDQLNREIKGKDGVILALVEAMAPLRRDAILAKYDDLTGLGNSRMLREDLEEAVSRYRRFGENVSVVFVDMDNLKHMNDSHGHDIGDAAIVKIADTIKSHIRDMDRVYRSNERGDEFVIRFAGADSSKIEEIVDRIKAFLIEEGVELTSNRTVPVSISTGMASITELQGKTGLNPLKTPGQHLMDLAESMMRKEKEAKPNKRR